MTDKTITVGLVQAAEQVVDELCALAEEEGADSERLWSIAHVLEAPLVAARAALKEQAE